MDAYQKSRLTGRLAEALRDPWEHNSINRLGGTNQEERRNGDYHEMSTTSA
jgi:hypothetical protein